jgi:ribonuclease HII
VPTGELERACRTEGYGVVCGVDEVGRGPWAGPVVAAAAILDFARLPRSLAAAIDDSKKLSPARRERLAIELAPYAQTALAEASIGEIDSLNILQASLLAMRRAVRALARPPDIALVDGNRAPILDCPARTVVGGDAISLSIAAASIVAKVARDAHMRELSRIHPGYGFERNMGYGTREHQEALRRFGPCPVHRRSFAPIRELLAARAGQSKIPKD